MACIIKLDKAISYDCKGGSVGVAELYLLNKADINTITNTTGLEVTAITLVSGGKSVPVDCVKNGVKVIEALKAGDTANGLDVSLTLTLYAKNADAARIIDAIMKGRFMAAVKFKDIGAEKVLLGVNCGLEVSQMDTDSSANGGFTTITIKTPDDAKGDRRVILNTTAWNTIVNAKLT